MQFVAFVLSIPVWFASGFVFMKLWEWFPHTIFNITALGYAESLGLMLFLGFIGSKKFDPPTESKEKQGEIALFRIGSYFIYLILAFVLGYIVHTFI